nr:hypothetical protein [Tanacetum cinerariifolium]
MAITTPGTTQAQLLRDPNKLYVDDSHPDLKGWELFFKEIFFCFIDKRNKVEELRTEQSFLVYCLKVGVSDRVTVRMGAVVTDGSVDNEGVADDI